MLGLGAGRPMGDAMGKSRHTPWSADFSGQWCTTVEECVVRRALHRISIK